MLACWSPASSPAGEAGNTSPTPAKVEAVSEGPIGKDVRAKICAAEHVDETSRLFPARNKAGVIERIVVTPSRTIADMGNLVFDTSGVLLGHETGSEFPWDDQKLAGEERIRVAALMGGAMVAKGEPPLTCGG